MSPHTSFYHNSPLTIVLFSDRHQNPTVLEKLVLMIFYFFPKGGSFSTEPQKQHTEKTLVSLRGERTETSKKWNSDPRYLENFKLLVSRTNSRLLPVVVGNNVTEGQGTPKAHRNTLGSTNTSFVCQLASNLSLDHPPANSRSWVRTYFPLVTLIYYRVYSPPA